MEWQAIVGIVGGVAGVVSMASAIYMLGYKLGNMESKLKAVDPVQLAAQMAIVAFRTSHTHSI